MNNKLFLIAAVLVMLSIQISVAQDKTVAAKMEFKTQQYDFGDIAPDTLIYHVFTFKNTGTDSLRVRGVRSS